MQGNLPRPLRCPLLQRFDVAPLHMAADLNSFRTMVPCLGHYPQNKGLSSLHPHKAVFVCWRGQEQVRSLYSYE